MPTDFADGWARWMLRDRFGGDEVALRVALEFLAPIRDRVLLGGGIQSGDVVLDVGCGDGLIGFGALQMVGDRGEVIFSDVSEQLLDRCRVIASQVASSVIAILSQPEQKPWMASTTGQSPPVPPSHTSDRL